MSKRITIEIPDSGAMKVTYEIELKSGALKAVGHAGYNDSIAEIESVMLSKMGSGIEQAKARHEELRKSIGSLPPEIEAGT